MTISVSPNNGQAPASALSTLPGTNGDGTPHTGPHVTVASYNRLRDAMRSGGMGDLLPSDGWSCYRDRAAQQRMRDLGLTTAAVGTSIHGEWTYGSAVDFSGLGGFGAARHNWLKANGGPLGWYQPGWAQQWGSLPEPWHWEYDSRNDTRNGEDDMPSADEIAQAVWNYTIQGTNPTTGGPWADGAAAWLRDARIDSVPDYVASKVWAWAIQGVNPTTGEPWSDVASAWLRDARSDSQPALQAQTIWGYDIDRPGVETTDAGTYVTGTAVATGAADPEGVGRHHGHDREVELSEATIERIAVVVAALLARTERD